jgi:hypothetical protein
MYGGCIANDPYRNYRRESELNTTIERITTRITRAAQIKTMVEESLGNSLGDVPVLVELEQMLTKTQNDLTALKEQMYGWAKPISADSDVTTIIEATKSEPERDQILASIRRILGDR